MKKRKKLEKKRDRLTVDNCCNPQWNVGGTVISPHHLDYVLIKDYLLKYGELKVRCLNKK
jgi:hypothetical protein